MNKPRPKNKTNVTKPAIPACPKCKSRKRIVPIVYGLPIMDELEQSGDFELGGCCVDSTSPRWTCRECGHRWGRVT